MQGIEQGARTARRPLAPKARGLGAAGLAALAIGLLGLSAAVARAAPPSSLPREVAAKMREMDAFCREMGGRPRGTGHLLAVDINGDSVGDYVVDENRYECSPILNPFVGNAGGSVMAYVTGPNRSAKLAFSIMTPSAKVVTQGRATTVVVPVSGLNCGVAPARSRALETYCDRALVWNSANQRVELGRLGASAAAQLRPPQAGAPGRSDAPQTPSARPAVERIGVWKFSQDASNPEWSATAEIQSWVKHGEYVSLHLRCEQREVVMFVGYSSNHVKLPEPRRTEVRNYLQGIMIDRPVLQVWNAGKVVATARWRSDEGGHAKVTPALMAQILASHGFELHGGREVFRFSNVNLGPALAGVIRQCRMRPPGYR